MSARLRSFLLILAACVSLFVAIWQVNPAVRWAEASVQDIAASMTGVYVSLRVINAALSAAQEIEIGASVGAQASLQPLKVLEPIDDTVERVADVVFAVAIGASVATVGLTPIAALGAAVLAFGLLGMAAGIMVPQWPNALDQMAQRAVRLGGAVAVVLPLVVTLGLELGDRMTVQPTTEAYAVLNGVAEEARLLIGQSDAVSDLAAGQAADTFIGRLSESLSAAGDAVDGAVAAVQDYSEAAGVFRSEATALFEAALTLIGVFVLRSLVLPILLFWGVLAILRRSLD